jgi:integral membrane sensor domain MASE1
MLQELPKQQGERQLSASRELMRHWQSSLVLVFAVAITYFLASQLSFFLRTVPDGVAWFWPAAGVAAGLLIAIGPGARLPVVVGTIVASIPGNLLGSWSLWTSIVFALCNAGQVLLVAGLIERYFGLSFCLDSLRKVLGLIMATIVGTTAAAIGGTAGVVLVEGSTAPVLTVWYHWMTSNVTGIVAVAPLLIGLVSAVRDPMPRIEILESVSALVSLTALSGSIILLPGDPWVIVALAALMSPLLLWLAARCRPVFAAAAAFIVALTIVWTATFSVGMFKTFPVAERILAAQATILVARRDSPAQICCCNASEIIG